MENSKKFDVIVVGSMYLDLNFIDQISLPARAHADNEIVSPRYDIAIGGSSYLFAKAISHLGLSALFIGQVGNDAIGKIVLKLAATDRVHTDILIHKKAQTNISTNVSGDNNDSLHLTAGDANQLLRPAQVLNMLKKQLQKSRMLYIGGYFKTPHLAPIYEAAAKCARALRRIIILDHGVVHHRVRPLHIRKLQKLLPYVDYYLPNQQEFLQAMRAKTIPQAYKKLQKISSKTVAIVKCGSNGAVVCSDNRITKVPTRKVKPIYTVGAGDSFNSGLIYGKIKGYSDQKATQIAHLVATIKITQGTLAQPQERLRHIKNF